MGKMELLFMQCRGIGPHLPDSGNSPIFSSSSGHSDSKPVFVQRHQNSCLVTVDISQELHEAWQVNMDASPAESGNPESLSTSHSDIGIPINFQQESGIANFGSTELHVPLEVSRGCEISSPDDGGT